MHARSRFIFVFLCITLFSMLPILVRAFFTTPPEGDTLIITSPSYGNYTQGEHLRIQVNILDMKFKEANPFVRILIQKHIKLPLVNDILGEVSDLLGKGFKFKLKKKWLIEEQARFPFRIRLGWDYPSPGRTYQDSADF
ncbi:hypothetical protein BGZ65_011582 [Modicella reniformis]|uniref:Uncharacterized protein n=1 Tax=Modicella reniformis TaxID=1440133 RepID=A0A9P6IQZ5_9FUNG|nr:hypothetical protein BGZ65_011582 [Modicella reniformis]